MNCRGGNTFGKILKKCPYYIVNAFAAFSALSKVEKIYISSLCRSNDSKCSELMLRVVLLLLNTINMLRDVDLM